MGKVTLLEETTRKPLTLMGERAGICWGSDIEDSEKNYKRGLECLKTNHGRVLEYVNIEMVLDGYSARVIREWYTHIGGAPTRLQASTRYINYQNFEFVIPPSVKNKDLALERYRSCMEEIQKCASFLDRGMSDSKRGCGHAPAAWHGNQDCGQAESEKLSGYLQTEDVYESILGIS